MKIRPGIVLGNISDVGCEREENEDYFGYFEPEDETQYQVKGRLAIVADGMGGMAGGFAASRTAVDVIHEAYAAHPSANPKQALNDAIEAANDVIFGQAEEDPSLRGMGTTVTAMVLKGDLAYFAQVGDSRAYLIRRGEITQYTRDQTKVARLVEEGIISAEDAEEHPDAHILSQAVGNKASVKVDTDMAPLEVRPGDRFLLCSDGLHGLVSDPEMLEIATSEDPNSACHTLVELAKQRGGHDNITVQIVQIQGGTGVMAAALPPSDTVADIPAAEAAPAKRNLMPLIIIGAVALLALGLGGGYLLFYKAPVKEVKDSGAKVYKDGGPEEPGELDDPGEEGENCKPPQQVCGHGRHRGCVDVKSSKWHCGRCDRPCRAPSRCRRGRCITVGGAASKKKKCNPPKRKCGKDCVDVRFHLQHCGKCGVKCDLKDCVNGKCTKLAAKGKCLGKQTSCNGKCVNLKTNSKNCGKCERICHAGKCNNGKCPDARCNSVNCPKGRCVNGKCEKKTCEKCGGAECVNFKTDRRNCGKCKARCTGGEKECKNGKCLCRDRKLKVCTMTCINPKTDPNNCGKCGKKCKTPKTQCRNGICKKPLKNK